MNLQTRHRAIPPMLAMLAILLLSPLLAACGSDEPSQAALASEPVDQLYNNGLDALHDRRFATAITQFDLVQQNYPYSTWAVNAQLMEGYTFYLQNKYTDAIGTLDRFIQLHPTHRDVAYAYYLRALCFYEQIADIERDQQGTQQAMTALQEVVNRFPGQRLRPRRAPEDRPVPRPSCRQGDGDRSLV
jgi:outer membrane protein assembly factor BamD